MCRCRPASARRGRAAFAVEVFKPAPAIWAWCAQPKARRTPAALRAYVYTFDVNTLLISASPVFQFPLDYPRGFGNYDPDPTLVPAGSKESALWNAWSPTYIALPAAITSGTWRTPVYPQPILSSLSFDADGNMTLGLRDRFGDQMGNEVSQILICRRN